MYNKVAIQTICLVLASILLLGYNDEPPKGRTGAPFNGHCNDCHSGINPGGYNGTAEIVGLPDTIQPNTTYPLQLKVMVTNGNPVKAGFQLVVVDQNNNNVGNLTAINNESGTDFLSGREYLDHRSGKFFSFGPVSWSFEWTAPSNALCNTVKFYYIVNFCNGSGDFGDYAVALNRSYYLAGAPPIWSLANTLSNASCQDNQDGVVTVQTSGGTPAYQYQWSNGIQTQTNTALPTGTYTVTVTDSNGCSHTSQTSVSVVDTVLPLIQCPLSFSLCSGDTVQYAAPSIQDNCTFETDQPELLSGLPSGSVFPEGTTVQVFQASDHVGNTATCSFSVQVFPLPTIDIDTIVHDKDNGGLGSIAVTIAGGSEPYSYLWKKDGVVFSNTLEDLTDLLSGTYVLEVVDSNGCSVTTASITLSNTVNIAIPLTSIAEIRIAPNPASGSFTVSFSDDPPVKIQLIALSGVVLFELETQGYDAAIDITDMPRGYYFLKLETSKGDIITSPVLIY